MNDITRTLTLISEHVRNNKSAALDCVWYECVTSGNKHRYADIIPWSNDRYLVRIWEWTPKKEN